MRNDEAIIEEILKALEPELRAGIRTAYNQGYYDGYQRAKDDLSAS